MNHNKGTAKGREERYKELDMDRNIEKQNTEKRSGGREWAI